MDALSCIDQCFITDETLEQLPVPAQVGKTESAGSTSTSRECAGLPKQSWLSRLLPVGSRL